MGNLVGISPQDALALCNSLQHSTDDMRAALANIGTNIGELAYSNYKSATMSAFLMKFDSESKPQLTKVLDTADTAVTGTREVIRVQIERQEQAAHSVQKV